MDPRAASHWSVTTVREALDRFNARHPWSHNEHFHPWILRNLPAGRQAAVDVGCGRGVLLGKLANTFSTTLGIDADEGMARATVARYKDAPGITVRHTTFAELVASSPATSFDVVTMVAVLHHLDLHETLAAIPRLLAPGGRLLVVGIARLESARELPLDLLSAAINPVVGMVKHPGPAVPRLAPERDAAPMIDPTMAFGTVVTAAGQLLPGAPARRRLFFRYTLRWDRP